MRGQSERDGSPFIPFIATKGYDSVVWNRLYSRDTSDLEDYQVDQASISCTQICFLSWPILENRWFPRFLLILNGVGLEDHFNMEETGLA